MKNNAEKRSPIRKSTWIAAIIFVLAAGLIGVVAVGGTNAVLTYYSESYSAHLEMYDIGVTLMEESVGDTKAHAAAYRNYIQKSDGQWDMGQEPLLANMLAEGEQLVLAKPYKEILSVYNSGTINEYVRVTVYKYWVDREGNKVTTLSPSLIDIDWANLDSDWLIASQTDERVVLYYNKMLPKGESSAPFTDTITVYVDDTIALAKTENREGNVIRYTYDYSGYKFQIEAEVDAVQEHNAHDAILSAWGVDVNVSDGILSLN